MKTIYKYLRKFFVLLLVLPIRFYQMAISPYLPMSCRHVPSCSQYTIEALKVHGVFYGLYLGVRRIIRCHPWGTHGYDPVPIKRPKAKSQKQTPVKSSKTKR